MRTSTIVLIIIVLGLGGLWLWRNSNDYNLPTGRVSIEKEIAVSDGEVVAEDDNIDEAELAEIIKQNTGNNNDGSSSSKIIVKTIMETDGVKHSVPIEDIRGGGPPKDGIPPIDNPKFITVSAAQDFLNDNEPGIAVDIDGISRFYPFQILVWHEIVNDKFNDQRVLVTYCPLCLSGIVFDPVVDGKRVEFGTSGKLWNSNLVMYDRETDSLWSQILGEAILGDKTGSVLAVLPSDQMRFGKWRQQNANGQVLSKDTGAVRFYGQDPYGSYYSEPGIFFPVDNSDNRLENKDFVLGIVVGEQSKAYLPSAIQKVGTLEDTFAGKNLIIEYQDDIDAVRIFEKTSSGDTVRINPFPNFWFSWVAAHPDTELYK